ncbi:MAG TPA: hypothetical protein VGS12_15890 [Caulobacteraceae bacterium]|nr:hypothetical protein [Caulobacteraceae bacterium]
MRFWNEFGELYGGALIGAVAVLPYTRRLLSQPRALGRHPPRLSPRALLLLGLAQNAALFALVVAAGIPAARAVGLGGLGRTSGAALTWAGVFGGAAGLLLVAIDLSLLPRLPALLELARNASLSENFFASFYGGLNEELLTRFFGVSAGAWLLSLPWRASPRPAGWMFWCAIGLMAAAFSLAHLPATRAAIGRLTTLAVARAFALNAPLGVLCGWLFWRFGIAAAMLAHFTADIVYHVGGSVLLRANDRFRFMRWIPVT